MNQANGKPSKFDHPSLLFVIEDRIKNLLGSSYYDKDIKSLDLKGGESVLDFGCGGGAASRRLLRYLGKKGHLLDVDTSIYWINVAARRLRKYPNAEVKAGDIRLMNLPEHSLDIIVIFHVIHDIVPEERQSILLKLSRLLKKDGRLFLKEPIRSPHGIPVHEIRSLLASVGTKEVTHTENKAEYRGVFVTEG